MRRSRFIAGAVCPMCGAVDRIVVEGDFDDRLRRCVECDFRETMSSGSSVTETSRSAAGGTALPEGVDVVRLTTVGGAVRSLDSR